MAAAEARAAWQRTANRYFMQEDAKRAPKLACCPGAVQSKCQSDSSNCDAVNGADHSTAAKLPVTWSSSINVSPETRWWLQWQPNFGNYTSENLKEIKFETGDAEMDHELPGNHNSSSDLPKNAERHADPVLVDSVVQNSSCGEGKALNNQHTAFKSVENKATGVQNTYDDDNAREDPKSSNQDYDSKISKTEDLAILEGFEKYAYDITSKPSDKGGLWWRTADENELATLVAQKSSEHIENCDLPPPQFKQKRKGSFPSDDKLCYGEFSESIIQYQEVCSDSIGMSVLSSFSKGSNHTSPFSVDRNMDIGPLLAGESHYPSINAVERAPSSANRTWSERQSFESEGDKAQILQALCHSQTRAREAEEAAAQAFSEKEQLVRLFLKEASHLFAYRQWLQLLQIETLCLKAKDQSVSWDQLRSLFPLFPWIPTKHKKWAGSNASGSKRHKGGRQKFDMSAWALAMALGLSLAGAGLFIGWSMGWLLPMF